MDKKWLYDFLFHAFVSFFRPVILKSYSGWIATFDAATDAIGGILFPVDGGESSGAEPLAAPVMGTYKDLIGAYAAKAPSMANIGVYTMMLVREVYGLPADATQREKYQAILAMLQLQQQKTHGVDVDWQGRPRPGSK